MIAKLYGYESEVGFANQIKSPAPFVLLNVTGQSLPRKAHFDWRTNHPL
jgi:hypothetical protein